MLMLASPMIGMCFSSVTNVSLSASNPAHSVLKLMKVLDVDYLKYIKATVWCIWASRNNGVFDRKRSSLDSGGASATVASIILY
ncbi:hypothetical protein HanRHA438_Chr09g0376601 [Helianthus annuus]|nr:hypothetical protein HanHA300_Chr16g0613871 [Helianthus annuus]KAJ0540738.1 hypothetical protein HanHA89_Chr09g0320291 [Helianthus annuus]KAJ0604348.1 hypothetical protein HanHA300_Chr02g0048771 [Helianthus annuus]KAJ0641163.1 hypothetical protein HanLR1_Chr16g0624141 [Helianthus annuus]KAJ0645077.1 hypothetical protein HanOQP8_Chr16g0619841 [Helianthus annuus]